MIDYWTICPLKLTRIMKLLVPAFDLVVIEEDAENVWQWLIAQGRSGSPRFHVSRPWNAKYAPYDRTPVHLEITKIQDAGLTVDEMGARVANALRVSVYWGVIRDVPGQEEKQYEPWRTYEPT